MHVCGCHGLAANCWAGAQGCICRALVSQVMAVNVLFGRVDKLGPRQVGPYGYTDTLMCSAKYKAPSPLRAPGFWLTCVLGVDWCLPCMLQGQARVAAGGTHRLRGARWAPTAPSTPRGGRPRLRASRARAARGWSAGPSRRALALPLKLLAWEPLILFPFLPGKGPGCPA